MRQCHDRRAFIVRGAAAAAFLPLAAPGLGGGRASSAIGQPDEGNVAPAGLGAPDDFPRQDRGRVQEMVSVAHGNLERVRSLVALDPELAKAAVDWGFGDWETALGAAAHTGSREIAELLLDHGARPDLFSAAMLGQIDVVRATVAARPGVQRTPGPHGITLLSHARAGGPPAAAVVEYLESLGDADERRRAFLLEDEYGPDALGTYRYGEGEDELLEVIEGSRGGVMVRRSGGVPRQLMVREAGAYHPAGAESVVVRFAFERGGASSITIRNAELTITGVRIVS